MATRFDKVRFAEAVRKDRGERGLRAYSEDSAVSVATISRIETGKSPDLETYLKLCDHMRVSPGTFLGENTFSEEIPAQMRGMLQHIADNIAKRQYWNAISWTYHLEGELIKSHDATMR